MKKEEFLKKIVDCLENKELRYYFGDEFGFCDYDAYVKYDETEGIKQYGVGPLGQSIPIKRVVTCLNINGEMYDLEGLFEDFNVTEDLSFLEEYDSEKAYEFLDFITTNAKSRNKKTDTTVNSYMNKDQFLEKIEQVLGGKKLYYYKKDSDGTETIVDARVLYDKDKGIYGKAIFNDGSSMEISNKDMYVDIGDYTYPLAYLFEDSGVTNKFEYLEKYPVEKVYSILEAWKKNL